MTFYLYLLFSFTFSIKLLSSQVITAYPNFDQAPTASSQFASFQYSLVPLSRALFETNPLKKFRKHEFANSIKYSSYSISRGELEILFDFADENKDDLLTHQEWDKVAALYIYPFEACDTDKNYLLSEEEYKVCAPLDPDNRSYDFRESIHENKHSLVHRALKTRPDNNLTLFSYFYLKMALFGWEKCHSSLTTISKTNFKCAIMTAFPIKISSFVKFDDMYETGRRLSNDNSAAELDFLSYIQVGYSVYAFTVLGQPMMNAFIEKDSFISAIRADRFPNQFNEKDVDYMFWLINNHPYHPVTQMDFPTFAYFFHYLRLFAWNSKTVPDQLTILELQNIIDDPLCDYRLKKAIQHSRANFTEKEYLEGSLVLQSLKTNPDNLFFDFKQVESNNTANGSAMFFKVMTDINKEYWGRQTYLRGLWLSNLFLSLCKEERWTVNQPTLLRDLPAQYDEVRPPINLDQRKNYSLYKRVPETVKFDLLTFLMTENFWYKTEEHTGKESAVITELMLKTILKDYGMSHLPDSVLDLSLKGFDALRRRIYDVYDTPFNLVVVQATTAEIVRNKEEINSNGLGGNKIERKFPEWDRRQVVSPFV